MDATTDLLLFWTARWVHDTTLSEPGRSPHFLCGTEPCRLVSASLNDILENRFARWNDVSLGCEPCSVRSCCSLMVRVGKIEFNKGKMNKFSDEEEKSTPFTPMPSPSIILHLRRRLPPAMLGIPFPNSTCRSYRRRPVDRLNSSRSASLQCSASSLAPIPDRRVEPESADVELPSLLLISIDDVGDTDPPPSSSRQYAGMAGASLLVRSDDRRWDVRCSGLGCSEDGRRGLVSGRALLCRGWY